MRRWYHVVLVIGLLLAGMAGPLGLMTGQSAAAQTPTELLTNPGFEDPFVQEGSADIFVATGWQAWYVVPDGVRYPTECREGAPADCKVHHIPVYRNTQPQNARIPPRARSGNSQQWGTSYAVYIAGVYQQVGNVTPGTRLRFSAFTQGFNCDDDRGCFGGVGEYGMSYEPGDMQTRVGIDPTGGTNAFSSSIVWSPYANPLDAFVQQSVEAVAQSSTVTVFIWSSPTFPELHTDIYVEDASLIAVGQGEPPTATPTQSGAPTQAGTPAPTNTPGTPPPTQTIPPNTGTYTIQSGDTLSAIAAQYNLTLDQLLALNPGLTRESVLQVGQVINIGGTAQPTTQPTATPTPAATETPVVTTTATTTLTIATSTPVANATPVQANSGLCLSAYDDVNGNGTRNDDELALAGVSFEVKDANGQTVASYTSDTQPEPNCLNNLPDGRYSVDVTLPAGRIATAETRWSLALLSGTAVKVIVGSQLPPAATAEPTSAPEIAPTPASAASAVPTRSSAPLGLLIGGAFILLSVAALAFVVSARRRQS